MTDIEKSSLSLEERDRLFAERRALIPDFNFGQATANVFDDMLVRSVPFYLEIQRMIGELSSGFVTPGSAIYDLGCSTCTTFLGLEPFLPADAAFRLVGIDSSKAMLDKARTKLAEHRFTRPVDLVVADLNEGVAIHDATVVILNLTLQFVRPMNRSGLISQIYGGLREGGALLLVEKVLGESELANRLFIKYYYQFKQRNGYSELEIAQKRESLENVLVPYYLRENIELLRHEGFSKVDVFFKWYNFCGILAIK